MNSLFNSRTVSVLAVTLTAMSVGVWCTGNVKFTLYRRGKSDLQFTAASSADLLTTNFDSALPCKFFIHGWQNDGTSPCITSLVHGYLERGGYNLVGVDWSYWASRISYPTAKSGVPVAAGILARLLSRLFELGVTRPESVHLLGFSLGSHLAGYTGAAFTEPKLARITGLDPAGPLYYEWDIDDRLDDTDAAFVDVIHTCGRTLGYFSRCGHLDFYPNGGCAPQPNCALLPNFCSHVESFRFYNATIYNETIYPAYRAASWQHFCDQGCKPEGQRPVYMGHLADTYSELQGQYITNTSVCSYLNTPVL